MKRILVIGHNDIRLMLKHWASYIWLFLVPLAFMYFMGFANRGPGDPSNPRPGVLVENDDTGFMGRVFMDELGAQGLNRVNPTNRNEAQRGIRIPTNFTERVLAKQQTKLEFFTIQGAGDEAAAMIELRLVRALIALNARLIEYVSKHGTNRPLAEDGLRELMRQVDPVALNSSFAGRKPIPVGFSLSLPGNLVMYLMMNLLIFGGATLASERRLGVLKRLAANPVTHSQLVLGKVYGLILLGAVQIVFGLLAGRFLFGVNVGENLPAITLTLLIYAWVAGSLGVLIASLIAGEDKIIGLCVLSSLLMAAMGGCWWPLEIVPDTLRMVAHAFPTAWAMDALHQLITFGGGFSQAKEEIGVLVLFGLAANAAAAKCFRVSS